MLSDLFFTINLTLSIIACIIGLFFSCLFILIVIINKQCRTMPNFLICNSILSVIFLTIIILISSIYGLRHDWFYYQPACTFRAYSIAASCASVCYSYLVQAISRLFFCIFYKQKYLLTYRMHCIMIILGYCISIFVPFIMHLMSENATELALELHFCVVTPSIFVTSIFCIIAGYIIPFTLIICIYAIILRHARQSTRRIVAFTFQSNTTTGTSNNSGLPNMKRELRMMRNMMIPLTSLVLAGTPYFLLILWPILLKSSPPEFLHFISINVITVTGQCTVLGIILIARDVRKCLFDYVKRLCQTT